MWVGGGQQLSLPSLTQSVTNVDGPFWLFSEEPGLGATSFICKYNFCTTEYKMLGFLLAFCYQNQAPGKKVIKTKAAHNSWIPIHRSSSALRASRKASRLIKYVGSSVMSTQTRLALPVSLAIIKVNCLNREKVIGINLRTRRMAAPGEQLIHKSLLDKKQKDI